MARHLEHFPMRDRRTQGLVRLLQTPSGGRALRVEMDKIELEKLLEKPERSEALRGMLQRKAATVSRQSSDEPATDLTEEFL